MKQGVKETPSIRQVGDLTVDLERRRVLRGGQPIDLPDRSFRLLAALVRNAPDEVRKDQLIAEVWDDAVVSDETLAQRVRLLRQNLGDDSQNPTYVASVRGRGYRLIAPVGPPAQPTPDRHSSVKNIVLAAVAVLAVAAAWFAITDTNTRATIDTDIGLQSAPGRANAIAVLPFDDMSATEDQQFLADGMHEELLSRLALIEDLSVVSRTSVERYRGGQVGLQQIATELDVAAVVEGSVRVHDEQLRVTVQLIDAASDEHIWAANFDREMSVEDIFALQTDVATQIARALELELNASPLTDTPLPTESIEAYNLYLLGRYHTVQLTRDDLEKAIGFLERAIDIDREFAAAYAALGWAYSFLGSEYGGSKPDDMYREAKEAALRAIALDADLADARTLHADILTWYDWDFEAAEKEYQRTVELDPLNVLGYALFLSTQERHEEAVAAMERRVAKQPNDPFVRINAGWRYYHAGESQKAIEAARAADDHVDAPILMGMAHLSRGDSAAAIEVFEWAVQTRGRSALNLINLAIAYYRDGRRADGEALRAEVEAIAEDGYVAPGLLAGLYFAAGDADRGFAKLEQAYGERSRDMIFLKVTETLRGYRDDPRYRALVAKVFTD